jgi:hypothetical protein
VNFKIETGDQETGFVIVGRNRYIIATGVFESQFGQVVVTGINFAFGTDLERTESRDNTAVLTVAAFRFNIQVVIGYTETSPGTFKAAEES